MKIIVSHIGPDIDSITATWLIKRFLPGWNQAILKFVPAGSTLDNQPPDSNPDIIHVDTGMGKFDHHQTNDYTCAALLVFQYLKKNKYLKKNQEQALERLVAQVNNFDHFGEINFSDPTADHYEFLISNIIDSGLKSIIKDDEEIMLAIFPILDGLLQIFIKKIKAEEELKKGYTFDSKWGKTIVFSSKNEEVVKLALKSGYKIVARKDPETGHIRIKTQPQKDLNLKSLYEKIIKIDKKADWFLHASGNMLLNGSSKNPHLTPSSLTLNQLIDIIKSI